MLVVDADVVVVVVVVVVVGQVQPALHSRNAPVGLPGSRQAGLLGRGGSHSSPASTTPLPQRATQSQQLPRPGLAVPPFGARQFATLLRMLHFNLPSGKVRQHRTRSVPQVDLAAHLTARPLHSGEAANAAFAH